MHPRHEHRGDPAPAVGSRPRADDLSASPAAPFGAYLHVPFCAARCDYCAFAAWDDRGHLEDAYLDALAAHVQAGWGEAPPATSVFVGGGTPSIVDPRRLVEVIGLLPRSPDVEVTVECNPDTVTDEMLEVYRDGGVTRISLGVQSVATHVLASLGRTHDPESVTAAVEAVRRVGFVSFNLDLIYGAAGESVDDWRATVDAALDLDPPHVSAYALTVEPGTPLAADAARHPDDDDQADKYDIVTERMDRAGLRWYEISNWASPGHECRHNLLYWRHGEYLAFGCAAHGHRDGRRYWNLRTPERYIDAVRSGRSTEAGAETLDSDTRRIEALQLALRTVDGVPFDAIPADDPAIAGLVERRADRLVLTPVGRRLANEVAVRLR